MERAHIIEQQSYHEGEEVFGTLGPHDGNLLPIEISTEAADL